MPKIERKDQEDLNSILTVKVEKSEYEPKFKSELIKFKNKAALKGFRKGKTPLSFVKKMYGERILIDIINELLGEAVNKYLEEEKLDILGAPIPSKDQEEVRFNPNDLIDYEFDYQIGLYPQIELAGLSDQEELDRFDVQVPDSMIDDEVERMLKQGGEQVEVDGPVSENDIMQFSATEMDGDEPKENGLTSEFSILYDSVTDEYKEKFDGQMVGAVVRADVFALEDKTDDSYVRKYFLNLEEDDIRLVGHWYDLEIIEINRIEKAELGEALFNKYFGEGRVKTEEDVRELFRKDIKAHYDSSADGLFFKTAMDHLFEKNEFSLPDNFLKNWIGFNSPSMSEADIENTYPDYADAMKRRIITSKLIDTYDLAVSEDELSGDS